MSKKELTVRAGYYCSSHKIYFNRDFDKEHVYIIINPDISQFVDNLAYELKEQGLNGEHELFLEFTAHIRKGKIK